MDNFEVNLFSSKIGLKDFSVLFCLETLMLILRIGIQKIDVQYSYQLTFSTLIALLIHFHIDSVVFSAIPLDKGDLDQTQLKSRFQSRGRP